MSENFYKVYDEIYGTYEVEPVLYELINCDAVQRLKKVHQGGGAFLVNENWNTTRYEHSIGVMLLIKMLDGSLEEQILGLLHDVSHTAFSHVVDYLLEESDEDYHEKIFDEMIEKSQIPSILKKYHLDYQKLFHQESTLLDTPLPELCADRIDYTLRDMYHAHLINKEEVAMFLKSLCVINQRIYINSLKMGEWFTKVYYREVMDLFMHPLNVFANMELTKVLKQALAENIIGFDDLCGDDDKVINKILNDSSFGLVEQFQAINSHVILIEDRQNYDIYQKLKPRMVNPTILLNDEKAKISDLSSECDDLIKHALTKLKEGIYLRKIEY